MTLAHHSVSATYIFGKSVRIEGTLKEFIWRNPHSFMRVEAPDEKGVKHIWIVEGAAPQQLTEGGLTASTLRPGRSGRRDRDGPGASRRTTSCCCTPSSGRRTASSGRVPTIRSDLMR